MADGQWSTHTMVSGNMPMAAWYWSGEDDVMDDPLGGPGSTLLYLCRPPLRGATGGDCYFPTICGCIWRYLININPSKCSNSVLWRHLYNTAQHGASNAGEPPQVAGIPGQSGQTKQKNRRYRLAEHETPMYETLKGTSSPGMLTQVANCKPVEVVGL
jgi:hypothetical protein